MPRFSTGSMAGARVGVYLILVRLTGRRLALSASSTFLSVQHFGLLSLLISRLLLSNYSERQKSNRTSRERAQDNQPLCGRTFARLGHGSAQADFNFSLIHRVTIGSYRSTSRLSHDYRDYRMTIATIAWLSCP